MDNLARQHILAVFISILLILCVFSPFCNFPIQHAGAAGWWNSSYNNYRTITVESDYIDANLDNFPLLVVINSTIGAKCDNGNSIRFLSMDNTTEFYYEIEKWDSLGNSYVWVNVSETLLSNTDYRFLMYYNNSGASDNQNPNNVWNSDYLIVQHLNDNTTATTIDSTSNNNDGVKKGINEPIEILGNIAYGQDFDGTDDKIQILDTPDLSYIGAKTISYWIKTDDAININAHVSKDWGGSDREWITLSKLLDGIKIYYYEFNSVGNDYLLSATSMVNISDNVWHYLTFTWDGVNSIGHMHIWIDGIDRNLDVYDIKDGAGCTPHDSEAYVELGIYSADNNNCLDGILDEFQLSDKVLSDSWIKTTFHNQNQTIGFLTFGSEQEPPGWWNNSYENYRKITVESDYIDANLDNFPLLVVLDNSSGDYTFHNSGADIEFVSTDNVTQFNHEIELFDNAGDTICWVNISETLTSGSDYSFLVYYNNPADSTVHHNPEDVWDNDYIMVQHMDDEDSILDSTFNDNDGAKAGNIDNNETFIGNAMWFDGVDDYITVLDSPSLSAVNTFTYQGWFKFTKTSNNPRIFDKHNAAGGYDNEYYMGIIGEDEIRITCYDGDNDYMTRKETSSVYNDGIWHLISFTYDGSLVHTGIAIYVDGIKVDDDGADTNPGMGVIYDGSDNVYLGGAEFTADNDYRGYIDEVHFSKIERNVSWVKSCFHNQNQSSHLGDFLSFGSEQSPNNPPTQSGEVPANQSTGISLTPNLHVLCNDADNDNMNATWWSNSSGAWLQFASNWTSFANNTNITQQFINASAYSTKYYWSLNLTDGIDWTNNTYHFTTNVLPTLSGESPINSSTGVSLTPGLYVVCTDANSDIMTATWRSNSSGAWVDFATNTSISTGTNITQTNSNFSAYNTTYYWSINLTDGYNWTNATYHFTTNVLPTLSGESPTNSSTGVSLTPALYVVCTDADSDVMTATWRSNSSGAWVDFATNTSISTGTNITQPNSNFSAYNTTYYWSVNLTDGDGWTNATYHFTTNVLPTLSGESPTNSSTGVSLTPGLYVVCTDADSDIMTATWRSNSSGAWVDFATNTSISTGTNITQPNSNFSAYNTTYYWSVNLTDGDGWTNETYHFTTNVLPALSDESPTNGSTGVSLTPALYVVCTDADSDIMTATWRSNSSGAWVDFATNTSISTGTNITQPNSNFSDYGTTYWWSVNLTDGDGWINETYHFTTNYVPTQSDEIPVDGSTGVSLFPVLSVTVADNDAGNLMNITFYSNVSGSWSQIGVVIENRSNGTYHQRFDEFGVYGEMYWWNCSVSDGMDSVSSGIFSFTAEDEPVIPLNYGTIKVYGTEYTQGEPGTAYAQVSYANETPANAANVYVTVWERVNKYIDNQQMIYIEGSNGCYHYNFTTPSNISVFMMDVNSSNPTAYGSGEFHVSEWASAIPNINETVSDINDTVNYMNDTLNYLNGTYLPALETKIDNIYTLLQTLNTSDLSVLVSSLYSVLNDTYNISYYLNNTIWASYIADDLFNISNQTFAVAGYINVTHWGNFTAYDLYNISNMTYWLVDAIENIVLHINTTTVAIGSWDWFEVRLTEFGEITPGDDYLAQITVFDKNGEMANADLAPTLSLYDSAGNLVVTGISMTWIATGQYVYSYTTAGGQPSGQWTTITRTTVGGHVVKNIIYWELESNPPEVTLTVVDNVFPSISAEISITNEGTGAQEYIYYWWITPRADGDLVDVDTVDSGSASKLIASLDTFTTIKILNVPALGTYWYKVRVYWGTEWSAASAQFDAISAPSAPGAGGIMPPIERFELTVICVDDRYNRIPGVKLDLFEDVRFLGSELTNETGVAVFGIPKSMVLSITAAKDGYETVVRSISVSGSMTEVIQMHKIAFAELPWLLLMIIIIIGGIILYCIYRKQTANVKKKRTRLS